MALGLGNEDDNTLALLDIAMTGGKEDLVEATNGETDGVEEVED